MLVVICDVSTALFTKIPAFDFLKSRFFSLYNSIETEELLNQGNKREK